MNKEEFRRKVQNTFPGEAVTWAHTETQNAATVRGLTFHNNVDSACVYDQSGGRCPGIELRAWST